MPGALNLPWSAVIEDGALQPAERLRPLFVGAGVDPERPIVTTCGSGVSAAILALALARLGAAWTSLSTMAHGANGGAGRILRWRRGGVTSPKGTLRDATRLLHSGTASEPLLRTVGPPIQKGSTVLLPNAAALYDETRPTYGRHGLASHEALIEALAVLEHATSVSSFHRASPP